MLIVSLPDFFVDRIIKINIDKKKFLEILDKKKSGNIIIENQKIKYGGNATNFSIILGKLGIENTLIVTTDKFGRCLLRYFAKGLPIRILVIPGKLNMTVALEFGNNNIMLSDPKGIVDFGPERIPEKVKKILEQADFICLFNWNQNRRANELIEFLYEIKKGKLYLDIGDPTVALDRLDDLIRLLERGYVDILALNENELNVLSLHLGTKDRDLMSTAKLTFDRLNLEHLDIHTRETAITVPEGVEVKNRVVSEDKIKNVTGAGDAWNAGNVYGYVKSFYPETRLAFAHRVARSYILGLI